MYLGVSWPTEQPRALDSSSGISDQQSVGSSPGCSMGSIPSCSMCFLERHTYNCFVLWMGYKAVGPVYTRIESVHKITQNNYCGRVGFNLGVSGSHTCSKHP